MTTRRSGTDQTIALSQWVKSHYTTQPTEFIRQSVACVSTNPCSKVTILKGKVKEKQIYSQEELELLLNKLQGEPTKYRAFFYLIAYSGLRRSEMLGLDMDA